MKDTLIKAIAHDGRIRLTIASTTNLVQEAREKHELWPTAAAALGRTLGMAALMSSNLKNDDEKIIIDIRGDGPLEKIVAEGHNDGTVRGYVGHPDVYLVNEANGKLDVGKAVGKGSLNVMRKTGLKTDYNSSVALQTGEIGDDFAYYYMMSEQIPSAVSVGVLVGEDSNIISAGAMLIEVLPDATDADIMIIEDVVKHLKPISSIFADGMEAKELALALFQDVEILDERSLSFHCGCSREQMKATISLLSIDEIQTFIDEDEGCEMICHYCNKHYQFNKDQLNEIIFEKQAHVH